MKALKVIGIVVVLALGCLMLLPSKVTVERSANIKAPASVVFAQVNDLHKWKAWSPWGRKDLEIYDTGYSGSESGVGSKHCWDSENEEVGKGCLTIVESEENKSIATTLEFDGMNPGTGSWAFEEIEGVTKVTWSMTADMGMNPMGKLFGLMMDGMVGPDFEKGLASIKEIAENMPAEAPKTESAYDIKEVDFGSKTYFAKREVIGFDDIQNHFASNFPAVFGAATQAGLEFAGAPSGLYYSFDFETKTTDLAAGVPVIADENTTIDGFERIDVSGKALLVEYFGAYDKSEDAHWAMDAYMKDKGLELSEVVIEEYITDPTEVTDTAKWQTNIYYLIK